MTRLQSVGSHIAVIAVDETKGEIDVRPFEKISLTRRTCNQLELHCPRDFAWRNGDYVLYLARKQYPTERFFWMLEPDVEHSFSSDSALFEHFDTQTDVDLLTPYFRESTVGWWWSQTARVRSTGVKRALFCIVRLSAPAIDLCLRERQKGRRSLRDRLCWANDEAFVATEIVYAGLSAADLNDFEPPAYNVGTLGFDKPINGAVESFRRFPNMIYHPVLYGSEFLKRIARIAEAEKTSYFVIKRRKLQRLLSAFTLDALRAGRQAR